MPKVRFTDNFDYSPSAHNPRNEAFGSVVIAYKAGQICDVKAECADMAIEAGKAVKVRAEKADGKE